MVGAPGEDAGSIVDAGAVTALSVGRTCIDTSCYVSVHSGPTHIQGRFGVPGVARPGNAFGASVSELPWYRRRHRGRSTRTNRRRTLTPPAPSPSSTPSRCQAQELHQNSPGVPGAAETGDRFYRLLPPLDGESAAEPRGVLWPRRADVSLVLNSWWRSQEIQEQDRPALCATRSRRRQQLRRVDRRLVRKDDLAGARHSILTQNAFEFCLLLVERAMGGEALCGRRCRRQRLPTGRSRSRQRG